jgi:CO/xanthine dehydrogenase Mo-binding subunit
MLTQVEHSSGAVVGAIGMALHEETATDHRFGGFMNHNLADYHVPVNADVHSIDVIFVDEQDDEINPLGVKSVNQHTGAIAYSIRVHCVNRYLALPPGVRPLFRGSSSFSRKAARTQRNRE